MGLAVSAGPFITFGGDGLAGEIPALSIPHDAMFCLMNRGGASDIILAYGRRELTLAALAQRVLIGVSRVIWSFVGLPASEGNTKDGERPFIAVMSGVAARSR